MGRLRDDPPGPERLRVLSKRLEARIVVPLLEALGKEFGRERVLAIARDTVVEVARQQGRALAEQLGGNDLSAFARGLDAWRKGDALEIEVLEQSPERFSFNVTRCRFAEMYKALGVPELGALLSCNRDFSMVEGLQRGGGARVHSDQTIMQGAPHCDFRFTRKP